MEQQPKRRRANRTEAAQSGQEQQRIAQWLKKIRFRKALFGVSEKDVWKKIGELNEMYQELLAAERIRYDTLLEYQQLHPAETQHPGEGSA